MNIREADVALEQTIEYLKSKWFVDGVGIVACSLVGPRGEIAMATSIYVSYGMFLHAEARSIRGLAKERTGVRMDTVTAVVTASPCIKESKTRSGQSCASLLKENGITRVHFGVLDTKQAESIAEYKTMGLEVTVTEDPKLAGACRGIIKLFEEIGALRGQGTNPWTEYKREISPRPFG